MSRLNSLDPLDSFESFEYPELMAMSAAAAETLSIKVLSVSIPVGPKRYRAKARCTYPVKLIVSYVIW